MISGRSRDTEDWSYDTENSALTTGINYILKYIKIENSFIVTIVDNITVFTIFRLNKCRFCASAKKHQNIEDEIDIFGIT